MQSKSLFQQLIYKIDNPWLSFLISESKKPYFQKLLKLLTIYQYRLTPSIDQILNAYSFCSLLDTKVLILGQDPYPTENVADGLAFSSNLSKTPASLKNIFQELFNCYGVYRTNNNLTDWAKQGVLLLNTSLTIIDHQTNSCARWPWNELIKNTIDHLNQTKQFYVVVLWGNHALKYEPYFDANKTKIFKTSHPSPLSAYKSFFNSQIFIKVNDALKEHDLEPIVWVTK